MDTEQSPTYHLIKDVIMELLAWKRKGARKAHKLSSYHARGTCHRWPRLTIMPASGLGYSDPLWAAEKGQVTYLRTQSRSVARTDAITGVSLKSILLSLKLNNLTSLLGCNDVLKLWDYWFTASPKTTKKIISVLSYFAQAGGCNGDERAPPSLRKAALWHPRPPRKQDFGWYPYYSP